MHSKKYRIRFNFLPERIQDHLSLRIRERKITPEDLLLLKEWIGTHPKAPNNEWWKDFGTFKLVGQGPFPKSVLDANQKPWGVRLANLVLIEDWLNAYPDSIKP